MARTVYVDADTGEEFSPDEIDLSQVEILGEESDESEDDDFGIDRLWQGAKDVAELAYGKAKKSAGGVIESVEDAIGLGTDFGESIQQSARADLETARRESSFDPKGTPQLIIDTLSDAAPTVAAIAATAMTGGGALPAIVIDALRNWGDVYSDVDFANEEKGSDTGATMAALKSTALNTAANILPFKMFLDPKKGFLKKAVIGGGIDTVLNPVTAVMDAGIKSDATDTPLTQDELEQTVWDSIKAGLMLGPIQAGAANLGARTGRAFSDAKHYRKNQKLDADLEQMNVKAPRLDMDQQLKDLQEQGLPLETQADIPPQQENGFTRRDPSMADIIKSEIQDGRRAHPDAQKMLEGPEALLGLPEPESRQMLEGPEAQEQLPGPRGDLLALPESDLRGAIDPDPTSIVDPVLNIPILTTRADSERTTPAGLKVPADTNIRELRPAPESTVDTPSSRIVLAGYNSRKPGDSVTEPPSKAVKWDAKTSQLLNADGVPYKDSDIFAYGESSIVKPFTTSGDVRPDLSPEEKGIVRASQKLDKPPALDYTKKGAKQPKNVVKEVVQQEAKKQTAKVVNPPEPAKVKIAPGQLHLGFLNKLKEWNKKFGERGAIQFFHEDPQVADDLDAKPLHRTEEADMTEGWLAGRDKQFADYRPETKSKAKKAWRAVATNLPAGEFRERLTKTYRWLITFPKTVAERAPKAFGTFYEAGNMAIVNKEKVARGMFEKAKSFYKLTENSQTRVGKVLYKARLAYLNNKIVVRLTPDYLAQLGLDAKEIQAVQDLRAVYDFGLQRALESVITRIQMDPRLSPEDKSAQINQAISTFQRDIGPNYVPLSRFGQYQVYMPPRPDLPKGRMERYETKKAYTRRVRYLQKQGFKQGTDFIADIRPEYTYDAYSAMPSELATSLSFFDPRFEGQPNKQGRFAGHLNEAEGIPGFSEDYGRALADYILSISKYSADQVFQGETQKQFANLKAMGLEHGNSLLYDFSDRYSKYILNGEDEAPGVKNAMAQYYLGLNVKSAAVNLTQTLLTTFPKLVGEFGFKGAIGAYKRGWSKASLYYLKPDLLAKSKNPADRALYNALEVAHKEGYLDAQVIRELSGRAVGKKSGLSLTDVTMSMFDGAEKMNRAVTFAAAYQQLKSSPKHQGLSEADIIRRAEKIVEDTQYNMSKANRPLIARGKWGSNLLLFKMFPGNYIRFLRNLTGSKHAGQAMATAIGMAGMLGGTASIPFWKYLEAALEKEGTSPRAAVREYLKAYPRFADAVLNGGFSLLGVNLGPSIGLDSSIPSEGSPAEVIANLVGGAPLSAAMRVFTAKDHLQSGDAYRAIESVMPEAIRNPMVAGRVRSEGLVTGGGVGLIKQEDVQTNDLIKKALGFNPSSWARAYEDNLSDIRIGAFGKDKGKIDQRLARLIANGKEDEAEQLAEEWDAQQEQEEFPKYVNWTNVNELAEIRKGNRKALDKRLPKNVREEARRRRALNDLEEYEDEDEDDD